MKKTGKRFEVCIESLSPQGEGIGRQLNDKNGSADSHRGKGRVVFVPRTLPGEQWLVEVYEQHSNFLKAMPVTLRNEPSSERRDPPCPHYAQCGGCQLQHLPYERQLHFKREWLQETFRRIGQINVAIPEIAAGVEFEYRNRMTFDLGVENRRAQMLMCDPWTSATRVEIQSCPLLEPKLNQALGDLREALDGVIEKNTKTIERGHHKSRVQVRRVGHGTYALVENFTMRNDQKRRFIEALIKSGRFDGVYEITDRSSASPPRIREFLEDREPYIEDDGTYIRLSPTAFLQVNQPIASRLYEYQAALETASAPVALDMYAGMGMLSRRLAERYASVIGVDRETAGNQILNAEDAIPFGVTLIQAEVESALPAFLERLGNHTPVFLNPPRAGLNDIVREVLRSFRPIDVVMTSCHPAALVRDVAALLEVGYEIRAIQPFDLFPQTFHLETVVHLRRTEG